jgi:hypothetical protein
MIDYQHLGLQQAIEIGLKNNKNIQISHLKQEMSVTKEKDLKMEKLPDIEFHTSYNQVTNLFQHQNGVFKKPQNMMLSMECMILPFCFHSGLYGWKN